MGPPNSVGEAWRSVPHTQPNPSSTTPTAHTQHTHTLTCTVLLTNAHQPHQLSLPAHREVVAFLATQKAHVPKKPPKRSASPAKKKGGGGKDGAKGKGKGGKGSPAKGGKGSPAKGSPGKAKAGSPPKGAKRKKG